MISFNVDQFSEKLSIISVPKTINRSFNILCSSINFKQEQEKMIGDHQLNISTLSDYTTSKSTTLFDVFDIKRTLYRMLVSLVLYGLLVFLGMAMFQNSAFAASYGRMGGSSSSWSPSSPSRSCLLYLYPFYYLSISRNRNSSWWSDWWTNCDYSCIKCNCDKVGRKRYKCTCLCHYKKPNTCTKCVSSTSSTPCTECNCDIQCTCICHKEVKNISTRITCNCNNQSKSNCTCICHHETEKISTCTTCNCNNRSTSNCTGNCLKEHEKLYTPCTNCNCNKEKEGSKSKQRFLKNRRKRNKCRCTCDCHTTYSTYCWCHINELSEQISSILVAPLAWFFPIVGSRKWILPALLISTPIAALIAINVEEMSENESVLLLQVGVLDKKRELQTKLNRIAKIADTSSLNGLNSILKGAVKALLQHYGSCHFAYLFVKYDKKDCKQCFKSILSNELGRYGREEETFTNVNGIKHEEKAVGKACSSGNDYAVVTILVHVGGKYLIPSLNYNVEHIKTVLQKFEWIRESKIKSVEVLWTPQKEDEAMSKQELCRDFELLKPVNFSGNVSP